jgi:septal ring factor EnvC (AmiA/AmiB activator)
MEHGCSLPRTIDAHVDAGKILTSFPEYEARRLSYRISELEAELRKTNGEALAIADQRDALETALSEAEKALDYIDHELGRPEGLGLPAPVVNASFKAREALASLRALKGGG